MWTDESHAQIDFNMHIDTTIPMLAYDLYLRNTGMDRRLPPPRSEMPIKKIFVNGGVVGLDPKTFQEFGGQTIKGLESLQEELSMPSSTTERVSLPDCRTGSKVPSPYVIFDGAFVNEKVGDENKITVIIAAGETKKRPVDKTKKFTAVMENGLDMRQENVDSIKLELYSGKDVIYRIGDDELSSAYIDAGIIDYENTLTHKMFKKICDAFFEFVRKKPLQRLVPANKSSKKKSHKFNLYVLPSDGNIRYEESRKKKLDTPILDSFGNETKYHPARPTINAKFMSYDDPAFTLNCKKKVEFYKLFNMGLESFDRVNLYPQDYFYLSGLYWYFQSDTDLEFERNHNGIYRQIFDNYSKLKSKPAKNKKVIMKAICMKQDNAKIEIFINENLTMSRLEGLLKIDDMRDIPNSAFESLIVQKDKSNMWSTYLEAVNAWIQGRTLERGHFVRVISYMLRDRLPGWLKKNQYADANRYIKNTFFCISLLTRTKDGNVGGIGMDLADKFSYGIGMIAGEYVRFKRNIGEDSNSLQEILTYSKYDREKLRFVHKRVCLGISLAKPAQEKKDSLDRITGFIHDKIPKEEIPDADAYRDNSYFFYKGVFERLGGKNE